MDSTHDELYTKWQKDPTQENLSGVVGALKPTLDGVIGSLGAADDPTIRTKAKAIAAKAVTTYDPARGAGLPTWVSSQLRDLGRYKRKTNGTGLPERTQLDAWNIHKATEELRDKKNRDPDVTELADYMGMPVKRIAEVRRVASRKNVGEAVGLEGESHGSDFVDEAASYLIPELDYQGRKILEHRTGYGGAEIKDANILAKELNMSKTAVSRKSADVLARLTDIINNMHEVYGR